MNCKQLITLTMLVYQVHREGYELSDFKEVFTRWDNAFAEEGWIAIFLANHDNSRMVNRFGNPSDEFRTPSTQMINTFLLSMRGTPYTYYGDEIGMTNIDMPNIEEYVDVSALGDYETAVANGEDLQDFMRLLNYKSRENGRTPMQWDTTKNAGFSDGMPWKRVNENHIDINVEAQDSDSNSILNHFRKMTKVRKENPVLVYGRYEIIQREHPTVYAFTRTLDEEKMLVVLNFSDKVSEINMDELRGANEILINNYADLNLQENRLSLEPYQAIVLKLVSS